ncbi:hypothetical protein EST38_g10557 [Candolleomyces aberdarensis]|uniref:Uncharacterized protein n=1 Tax=Candolleomyces aberdarensis TaxID=2316362 RepID=A0A4V1Q2J4_9AGAR|nr:hypothetical protein EST38_g10557 [Candolleomyces aberdarensis]
MDAMLLQANSAPEHPAPPTGPSHLDIDPTLQDPTLNPQFSSQIRLTYTACKLDERARLKAHTAEEVVCTHAKARIERMLNVVAWVKVPSLPYTIDVLDTCDVLLHAENVKVLPGVDKYVNLFKKHLPMTPNIHTGLMQERAVVQSKRNAHYVASFKDEEQT